MGGADGYIGAMMVWFALSCRPGTGFDDRPPINVDPDADADADADADGDADLPTTTATTTTIPTGLVINEVLALPPVGLPGDANCDGNRNTYDDEFVEIVNLGPSPVDLSAGSLTVAGVPRHLFADGFVMNVGSVVVVFGGGIPGLYPERDWCSTLIDGSVVVLTADELMRIGDGGDDVQVRNGLGQILNQVSFGEEAGLDASLVRDPEVDPRVSLVPHDQVANSIGPFSPGTRADGGPLR